MDQHIAPTLAVALVDLRKSVQGNGKLPETITFFWGVRVQSLWFVARGTPSGGDPTGFSSP